MSKFRITYYAEGHRNGCKVTLHDVCGYGLRRFHH